ncbi:MAG TPA: phosphate ABC transporter substrate-binding protein PstS [Salinivirgaceae bacterium]|nr:phosphate ABC transporter substrate-binding protein PstS [Salinivirgaceae bacterium]
MNLRTTFFIMLAAFSIAALSCQNKGTVTLSGAGATFPQPFYLMTFKSYFEATNNTVSYGGIGSGGGIKSLKESIVDFAGTDAFLTDEEMKDMPPVIHIPTCMGAVVLAYNLQGVTTLKLTGDLVAKIYAGQIRYWDDEQLKAVNEGVNLPHKEIAPIYRSDGSGTTFVFTDYLSKVNSDWKQQFGGDKSVSFPVGFAAKGNPGVAGVLSQTDGSIGYIGSEYAFAQQLSFASIQNANGEFVTPTSSSISIAANTNIPEDSRCMITNSQEPGAYPISLFTWIIVYEELNNGKRTEADAEALKSLLRYMLSDEVQASTEKVHYAPIPASVKEQALKNIDRMVYTNKEN